MKSPFFLALFFFGIAHAEIPSEVKCTSTHYSCTDGSIVVETECDNYIADWVTINYIIRGAAQVEKAKDALVKLNCSEI